MKKYFEFPFNSEVEQKLIRYYENSDLAQHGSIQNIKTDLKIEKILKYIDFSKDDNLLDVGCSSGYFLRKISPKINSGKGLDISNTVISYNKKNNQLKNIDFDTYDGINIPYENKFDKLTLLDVLEHAFYPDLLIKNIYKAMKDNGILVVQVPFTGWLSEMLTFKYHQGHIRYYDDKYLANYLKKNGFKIKDIYVYNSVPYSSFFLKRSFKLWNVINKFVNIIPSKIYPYFGEIMIIAEKNELL